jgi:hypothetical protein
MVSGTKVICVDDRFPPEILIYYTNLPLKDKVYTVRDVEVGVGLNGEAGEIAVTLAELVNPVSEIPPHRERGFKVERFRELEPEVEVAEERLEELEQMA